MTQAWKRLRDLAAQAEQAPIFPLSMTNGHKLLVRAYESGNVETTSHIKQRCVERRFSTVDVENIVRNGTIVGKPKFAPDYGNWCFILRGKSAGKNLEVRVGLYLDVNCDSPLIVLITGMRIGGSNAEGDDEQK
jgi:hypothetical protein